MQRETGMTTLAVFGAGRIGRIHALNAAALSAVSVRYLVDPIASPGRDDLAARLRARVAEAEQVFADPSIDGIVIASSTDTHAALMLAASRAGKAIFCEKPVSLDFRTVEEVSAAVAESGVPCMLGFQRRYDPNFRALRDRVASGVAGRLEHVVMHTRDPSPPPVAYVERSGGLFRDQAIHDFDMARYLLGEEIRTVYAVGACLIDPVIGAAGDVDTAMVTLTSVSGRFVQMVNCRRAPFGYDQRLEALCEREVLYVANRPRSDLVVATAAGVSHGTAGELLHRAVRRGLSARDGGFPHALARRNRTARRHRGRLGGAASRRGRAELDAIRSSRPPRPRLAAGRCLNTRTTSVTFPKSLPRPRVPLQEGVPRLRWAIAGPGWIAERFVATLKAHTRQEVAAAASSDPARARAFAERMGVPKSYRTPDMLADPDVDVVYVATVHNRHLPDALAAIDAGKHVLVEKPLALNAAEGRRLRDAARDRGVFLMEAYWADFLPKFDVIRQLLADGALGEVRTVVADHGEWFGPEHRIMRADLAGGPMLDLGTYPVALATKVLGRPERVLAIGEGAPSGVNGQCAMLLSHAGGAQSVLHTSILGHTPGDAVISGTGGMLTIPGRYSTRPGRSRSPPTTSRPSSSSRRSGTTTPSCSTKPSTSRPAWGTASRSHPCGRSPTAC